MEFIERVPLERCHYALTISLKEYKSILQKRSVKMSLDDIEPYYNQMRDFCKDMIKSNGEMKRLYKFSGSKSWGEEGGKGRLFCVGNGLQRITREVRSFLLKDTTTDIDMCNAHPVILRYICKFYNIPCEALEHYIEHRDEILNDFASREEGKTAFLKATNCDTPDTKISNSFFKRYDAELKMIQKLVTQKKAYKAIVDDVDSAKIYNWYGSAINRILCYYENQILQVMVDKLNELDLEVCALMFDGCEIYGDHYDDSKLLKKLEKAINNAFEGLDMKLSYKEHETPFRIPKDYKIPTKEEQLQSYEDIAKKFEQNHFKIRNSAIYVKRHKGENIFITQKDLSIAYKDVGMSGPKQSCDK